MSWVWEISNNDIIFRHEYVNAHATILVLLRAGDSVKVEYNYGGATDDKSMNYFFGYIVEES